MTIATFPPQIKKQTFGRAIREERERCPGHTQEYCARLIGYTRRQWINWESDQSMPCGTGLKLLFGLYPNLKAKWLSHGFHPDSSDLKQ